MESLEIEKQFNILWQRYHDNKQPEVVEDLCRKAAFMICQLQILQDNISKEGPIIHTTNGNGFPVVKTNPSLAEYDKLMKVYLSTIRMLNNIVPETSSSIEDIDAMLNNEEISPEVKKQLEKQKEELIIEDTFFK